MHPRGTVRVATDLDFAVRGCCETLTQDVLADVVAPAISQVVLQRLFVEEEEEEEGFYKLRPANKTDHLCQSWQ